MNRTAPHILLVEDERAHAELIRRAFEGYNRHIELHIANNLYEARASLAATTPNLIISDLRLPDGDGAELLPTDDKTLDYPVVIMTSHGDEQVAVEAMKAGALDYVVKSETTLADMPRIAERALREWGHIIERKQAESALRESEERFRRIFADGPLGMGVIDTHLALINVNATLCQMIGYTEAELIDQPITAFFHPEDKNRGQELAERLFSGKTPTFTTEHRFLKKDGQTIWVRMTASTICDAEGEVVYGLSMIEDITERRLLEREIVEISNREQRRIGQDLHDELGQLLTGICFRMAELEDDLQRSNQPEVADAAEIGELVQEAITQTRALARGLNPINIEVGGLRTALRALTQSIEQIYEIPCILTCPEPVFIDDNETATHVYRIAQEALNNALKHSKASRLEVSLLQDGTTVTLTARDNGIGLSLPAAQSEGMGLRNMRYRASMINGSFNISAGKHGGTVVSCQFTTTPSPQPQEQLTL